MDMVLHRANITKLDTSNKNRYGNLAFKDCMLKVPGIIRENVQKSFPNMNWALMNEVVIYFSDSWGNHQRIDYGTLHELSFFCLLFALFIGNYFEYDDFQAVVQILVYKYYRVSNQIIQRFNLEPAGNLGFLLPDQYQFLSFLFGSSELIGESQITPTDSVPITRQNEEYDYFIRSTAEDYFYFETLLTATKNKSGPFSEHSKFLWDVSRVEAWSKIYHGLLNMYRSEILQRRPMIQHFLYGGLLSSKPRDVPQVGSEAKDQNAA
ncbi:MAG: Serine/threonine-protein phosphatase 2A activator [Marteilia pararefringens]